MAKTGREIPDIEQNTKTEEVETNSSNKISLFFHSPKVTSPWVCSKSLSVSCYPKDSLDPLNRSDPPMTMTTVLPRSSIPVLPTHSKALAVVGLFQEWEKTKKSHTNNPLS